MFLSYYVLIHPLVELRLCTSEFWCGKILFTSSEKRKRNRSLTKEEIAAYWRTKKEIEEEHLRAVPNLSETTQVWYWHLYIFRPFMCVYFCIGVQGLKKKIAANKLRFVIIMDTGQASKYEKLEKKCKKSSKVPLACRVTKSLDTNDDTSLEQLINKNDW